jgi:hypothetical protein
MKYLLALNLLIFSSPLFADEESSSESFLLHLEIGKISAPLSFYREDWNPKEKIPLKFLGIPVEEKNLVVNLDEAIRASRKEQDSIRSQNGWLTESNSSISTDEFCEAVKD